MCSSWQSSVTELEDSKFLQRQGAGVAVTGEHVKARRQVFVVADGRAVGRHLDATVHTGLFCRYQPDPTYAPTWDVQW